MHKILIYNSNEPMPTQGGMERVTDLLARELSLVGVQVILLYKYPNRIGQQYEAPVPIYRLPDRDSSAFFATLIKKENIHIIIDQTEGGIIGPRGIYDSRKKAEAQLGHKVKFIAVQHSSALSYIRNLTSIIVPKSSSNFLSKANRVFIRRIILPLKRRHSINYTRHKFARLEANYDKIVTLSAGFIDDFTFFRPKTDRNKLIAIPNFNTFKYATPTKMENKVLFVGRLNINPKGVDRLLRIWKIIENRHSAWTLEIVGDGDDRQYLENMAFDLDLKNVMFHGYHDPRSYYEHASIFCMTSTYEGFGMVLTEAMQHGCVPMAFDSYSSASDIIDNGTNGFLIEPFDEQKYARTLSLLIEDAEMRKNMSVAAIKKAEIFSAGNIIEKWISLFDNLVN